jgi:probable HAF family extracellular repeat protein
MPNGKVISLGGLPGSTSSSASDINDAGQVVGYSVVDGDEYATEWMPNGKVINLGGLAGSASSNALGINDRGQVVGDSQFPAPPPPPITVPEPSTWTMMLIGFAGLAFAGYRRAKAANATLACFW